jgi:hypothetical protein
MDPAGGCAMNPLTCRACGEQFINPPVVNPPRPRRRRRESRYAGHRGCCPRCYRRWANHFWVGDGPPTPRARQRVGSSSAGRVESYAELRSWGLSRAEAAARIGVTRRTVERYEARMAADGAA